MAASPRFTTTMSSPSSMSFLNRILLDCHLESWIQLTRIKYFAGSMVVFWPFAWALTMSARTVSLPLVNLCSLMIIGFIGAFLSHSLSLPMIITRAGCVWNDILDRNFDAQVERTKQRPLASGRISVLGASLFLCTHLVILIAMIWDVNRVAWNVGLLALFPLTGIYPFMKRITYWPQAWLGIAINIGISMAWATTTATIPLNSLVLSAGCFFWTLWYDTIYACQDKKDDVKAGVKSTALLFGSRVKRILAIFGAIFMSALTFSGIMNNQGVSFLILSVLCGSLHLAWQLYSVDVDSPKSCWRTFEINGFYFGAVIESGLVLDYLLS